MRASSKRFDLFWQEKYLNVKNAIILAALVQSETVFGSPFETGRRAEWKNPTDFTLWWEHFFTNFLCKCVLGAFLAEISVVICDREEKAASLLENKENGTTPKLSCLVLFNDFSQAFVERAKSCEVEVLKLEQLMVSWGGGRSHLNVAPFNRLIVADVQIDTSNSSLSTS